VVRLPGAGCGQGGDMMGADGLVRLNRWDKPSENRDDYLDLSEFDVFWDSVNKIYKVKYSCASCWKHIGWFCYEIHQTTDMIHEVLEGMLCYPCYEAEVEAEDIDNDDFEPRAGVRCTC